MKRTGGIEMWAIVGIIIVHALIIWMEVPTLLRNNERKELVGFSILLFIGFVLSILESTTIELPNPLDFVTFIYKPVSDFVNGLLE